MTQTPLTGLSHLDLSVSDRRASAQWYSKVLGFEIQGDRYNEAAHLSWVHLTHPCGLSLGLVEHRDGPGEPFDDRRLGLDHVSFAVDSPDDVLTMVRLAEQHTGAAPAVNETPSAVLVTFRDPDHIQIEVCCWKETNAT